jgi:hypothetical protein
MAVRVADARRFILDLDNVVEGTSYGMPAFLVNGRFLARFRDDDTVLVVQLASIDDRDVLIEVNPDAFFFTEHYRNYPAVLIRLAKVPAVLFRDIVTAAWKHASSLPPKKPGPKKRRPNRGPSVSGRRR